MRFAEGLPHSKSLSSTSKRDTGIWTLGRETRGGLRTEKEDMGQYSIEKEIMINQLIHNGPRSQFLCCHNIIRRFYNLFIILIPGQNNQITSKYVHPSVCRSVIIFKQEAQRATYRAAEYNVPPFWGIRQGGHLCLLNDEKYKLGRGHWDLASRQVSLNSNQQFRGEDKLSQPIRGHGGHLVFPIRPKNTNLVEDVEILLPVKFCWISVQRFQRRSLKCEKLTTDGRTDGQTDGRRTTRDHNSALEPSAQVH